ncbi:linear gramicidin dehydrogenase LgrE [Clostridium puniceum]|uniref:Linear gramicidin dehydrogenase LgrE n=1 Tax=Clostridium puniceum TaxID=29367 RepID=A0A1S8T1W0_9CLOT|nr:thioesterase domain-containing protein [Clostridium puniceum]OOM71668.1 linear gramicidin dehydrogenase LgrE [Clostridium puniceum]
MRDLIKNCKNIDISKTIMFCFPFAGVGAAYFNRWIKYFKDDIVVCPIHLPGREEKIMEDPYVNMELLIDDLFEEISNYSSNNIILFGHSMGAKIAYEIAKKLELASYPAKQLIISGSRVPHIPESNPIYNLPDEEFIKAIVRFDGTPKEILYNKELLKFFLPMLKADFTMDEKYHTTEVVKLSCQITAFGGISDKEADEEAMKEWKEYTKSNFKIFMFEGKHFFIRDKEAEILNIISQGIRGFKKLGEIE